MYTMYAMFDSHLFLSAHLMLFRRPFWSAWTTLKSSWGTQISIAFASTERHCMRLQHNLSIKRCLRNLYFLPSSSSSRNQLSKAYCSFVALAEVKTWKPRMQRWSKCMADLQLVRYAHLAVGLEWAPWCWIGSKQTVYSFGNFDPIGQITGVTQKWTRCKHHDCNPSQYERIKTVATD